MDEHGELRPWTIDDPDGVEERRRAVGLPPLTDQEPGDEPSPPDPAARLREADEWARSVGWR